MKNLDNLLSLSRHCQRNNISLRQLCILVLLRKKAATPSHIAEQLSITNAAITGQAEALINKALIERAPVDPKHTDNRTLQLTDRGTQIITTASASLLQARD